MPSFYLVHTDSGGLPDPIPWTIEYPQEFRDRLASPLAGYFYGSSSIDLRYENGYFAATERMGFLNFRYNSLT